MVKENHGSEINQMAFCLNQRHNKTPFGLEHVKVFELRGGVKRDAMDNSNVIGTTGGPQVTHGDHEHGNNGVRDQDHLKTDCLSKQTRYDNRPIFTTMSTVVTIWISCLISCLTLLARVEQRSSQ